MAPPACAAADIVCFLHLSARLLDSWAAAAPGRTLAHACAARRTARPCGGLRAGPACEGPDAGASLPRPSAPWAAGGWVPGTDFAGRVGANRTLHIVLDEEALSGELIVKLEDASRAGGQHRAVEIESLNYTCKIPRTAYREHGEQRAADDSALVVDIAGRSNSILARLSALTKPGAPVLNLHRLRDRALVFVVERADSDRSHVVVEGVKLWKVERSPDEDATELGAWRWKRRTSTESGRVPADLAAALSTRRRRGHSAGAAEHQA